MTLIQLEYILAIANYGSFVEAANSCHVTQPALTTQVKNLERELDIVIFDRTRKPIVPTEIGSQIINRAQEVVMMSKSIPDLVLEYNADVKGDLKLGIIPTVSSYLVPKFINRFNKYHPDVNVNVQEEITEQVIARLKNGELDAGIIATPVDTKGIVTIPLYYEKFYAYLAKSHPLFHQSSISADDLVAEDVWLLKEGNCFRDQVLNLCSPDLEEEFKGHFKYESHSIEALKTIVNVKNGLTLVPELALTDQDREDQIVKPLSDTNPVREISIVVNRQFLKKRLIDSLAETIKESMPEHMLDAKKQEIIDPLVKV